MADSGFCRSALSGFWIESSWQQRVRPSPSQPRLHAQLPPNSLPLPEFENLSKLRQHNTAIMNLPSHLKRAASNTMPALMNQDAHPTTATSTYNAAWPSSPPRRSSPAPDTTSPVYPGRPIRPMPKRRIRDRLSAEHAATIDYPPQPASSSPIFGYPYATAEAEMLASQGGGGHYARPRGLRAGSHEPCVDCGHEHGELSSDEEDEDDGEHRHPAMQFSPDSLQMTRRDGDYYGTLPSERQSRTRKRC